MRDCSVGLIECLSECYWLNFDFIAEQFILNILMISKYVFRLMRHYIIDVRQWYICWQRLFPWIIKIIWRLIMCSNFLHIMCNKYFSNHCTKFHFDCKNETSIHEDFQYLKSTIIHFLGTYYPILIILSRTILSISITFLISYHVPESCLSPAPLITQRPPTRIAQFIASQPILIFICCHWRPNDVPLLGIPNSTINS